MYVCRNIYTYILLVILPTIPPVALHFAHSQKLQKKNQDYKDNDAGDGIPSGNHFAWQYFLKVTNKKSKS